MTMLAKIHPYNPSLGYHRKRHICPPYTFREERGWYEVDDEMAEKLRKEYNNSGDPSSRPVFIIASKDEAGAMDKAEKEVAAKADAPRPLPKEVSKKLEDEFDAEFDGEEDMAPESEDPESEDPESEDPEAKDSESESEDSKAETPKKTAKKRKKATRRRKKS